MNENFKREEKVHCFYIGIVYTFRRFPSNNPNNQMLKEAGIMELLIALIMRMVSFEVGFTTSGTQEQT